MFLIGASHDRSLSPDPSKFLAVPNSPKQVLSYASGPKTGTSYLPGAVQGSE